MSTSMPRIAAAYIRVSTDDQAEFSPAAQLRELREFAAGNALLLDERYIFSDEGISGRKAEKRPGFLRMIAEARSAAHPFDVILVHKFDRFARSREDSIVYKSMLKRAGVEVISIKEPLYDGSYSGVMEAIYESFAEAYSINLGQEVRKGMTEKALRGEPQTAPPFGYRLENGVFLPHETEAPLVRELFTRFADGEGFFPLAKWLNAQGVTTHRGTPFENRTVEYILRNPVYIGKLRWNPKRRSRRNYDDPDILTVPGKHQPLVEEAQWNAVQAQIAELKARLRYHARPSSERKHWLCGIVRCAACGTTLVFAKPHFMKCNNYVRGRCAHSQHIAVEVLAEAVLERLREDCHAAVPPQFQALRVSGEAGKQQRELHLAIERSQKKLDRLTDAYLNAAVELDEFKRLRTPLTDEIAAAQAALMQAERKQTEVDAVEVLRNEIRSTIDTLESASPIPTKYDALNAIVARCTFDRSTSTLTLTYRISI